MENEISEKLKNMMFLSSDGCEFEWDATITSENKDELKIRRVKTDKSWFDILKLLISELEKQLPENAFFEKKTD